MNLRNAARAVGTRLRALSAIVFQRFPRARMFFGGGADEPNYAALVGDGRTSNLLMSCISWIVNGFTQMRPMVVTLDDEGIVTSRTLRHPALTVFRRPAFDVDRGFSPFTWMTLIAGLVISFIVDGNAYAFKIRGAGGAGRPVQLWYIPHWMVKPMNDPEHPATFIDYYDYCPDGVNHYPVRVEDVIHLRDGIDPDDVRRGLSKTKTLLREIATDEQAAAWTWTLLRNHAVPGLILAPKQPLSDETDGEEVENRINQKLTGRGRGRTVVMLDPTEVTQYGFSPEQMKLGDIRDNPEERVSSSTGVQAAVVGLGAGLQSTKVGATMAELVDLSWMNGVLPKSRGIGGQLTEQLLTEFEPTAGDGTEFQFDTAQVPIMADYHYKVAQTQEVLFRSGIATRGMAARAAGLKPGKRDDVYMLQAGAVEVDANKTLEETQKAEADAQAKRLAAQKPPANGNGTGNGTGAIAETVPVAV